jgi:hypothetical protein
MNNFNIKGNLSPSNCTESMKDSKIVTSESFHDLFDCADVLLRITGADNIEFTNNGIEPTPIGPQGIQNIVPNLPLSRIREWKYLDEEKKVFFSTTEKQIDPIVNHLTGIMNESISSIGFDPKTEHANKTNQVDATCASDSSSSIAIVTSMESNRRLSPQPFFQNGQWDERYEDLVQFRKDHGHSAVPHNYVQNIPLAQWVKR